MASKNIVVFGDEENQLSGGTNRVQTCSSSTPRNRNTIDDEGKKPNFLSFSERLGVPDFFCLDVWRASMGELLGTAVLVFMLDTIVISTFESDTKMPNLIMSILIAVVITILLLAVVPVSGGHINPVISFSAALVGIISMSRAIIYIMAQCIGAILGALALRAVVSSSIEDTFSLGGCTVTIIAPGPNGPITLGLETAQALWLEIFCTFVFLFASIWMAYDHRQAKALGHVTVLSIVGVVLGLLVFISTTVTGKKGYGGAGINPARCLGPRLLEEVTFGMDIGSFGLGQLLVVAFYVYTKIIPTKHFNAECGYKHLYIL
ncbi:uncharacterized protein LOC125864351 isoform X8 [Solanum stenotomum]|uniref:uncharacterized protein LOC125864351 isoform X8 n=1 Tax=Solanum stenotomum TaxID=172797 RepID=UPI0020D14D0A|nr:uncharacterized protein LOC125864351 isoform X8 [Solanum stenotomum]